VSEATGVSERTIKRILKERKEHEEQGTSFGMPGKKHNVPRRITEIDNLDKCVVRRTIHSLYAQEGTVPTIAKLLVKLKDSINFKGGCSSLRKIIRDLGFRWKRPGQTEGCSLKGTIYDLCVYRTWLQSEDTQPMDAQSYSKMKLTFTAAIPDRRIGMTIIIPVCWRRHQKARDLSLFMLEEERALFQMHFSYINLGRKLEITTMKWRIKIMPAG
jgi:hypothetical protein